jgi:hypothetical protein
VANLRIIESSAVRLALLDDALPILLLHRVLDVLVAEVGLQRPGIDAVVGELEAAGVAQHVRVHLELEAGGFGGTREHAGKAGSRERSAALAHKHEWRTLGFALSLSTPIRISREQMAVNRLVAGSNPARGATVNQILSAIRILQFYSVWHAIGTQAGAGRRLYEHAGSIESDFPAFAELEALGG